MKKVERNVENLGAFVPLRFLSHSRLRSRRAIFIFSGPLERGPSVCKTVEFSRRYQMGSLLISKLETPHVNLRGSEGMSLSSLFRLSIFFFSVLPPF